VATTTLAAATRPSVVSSRKSPEAAARLTRVTLTPVRTGASIISR
jgi:hypothetical protein